MPLIKELIYIPVSERKSKLFEMPVHVTNDLISDLYVKENLHWVLNMSYNDIKRLEESIRREYEDSQNTIVRDSDYESKASLEPTLREMMSSTDVTNPAIAADITSAV